MSIIIAIIVFSVIVLVHELGHFFAARKNGILVEEFAIGMGPKIFGVKKGDTLYSIRLLPLGGFCKMLGEDESSNDTRSFSSKTVAQRIVVISGGVVMNFLLAFLIFVSLSLVDGFAKPVISSVVEGMPAAKAGILPGDKIVSINGSKVNIYDDMSFAISESSGSSITFEIKRGNEKMTKVITPEKIENSYFIGIKSSVISGLFGEAAEGTVKGNILDYIVNGFWSVIFWIKLILVGIVRLFTFNVSINEMAGPIGMVSEINKTYVTTISQSVFVTIKVMAKYIAILSANLGVFNLLPLPALDGGRLVFLGIEGLRGKPLPPEREGMVHFIGFVLLMVLAGVIAFNDIAKLL